MCGIVGYIGPKNLKEELINNLKKLEYRGYDSAGIAHITNGKIEIEKSEGKISNLELKLNNKTGTCGIGHTRWATHGLATTINAHPHLSENEEWAVVHNGIIENYLEIKDELISKFNIKFTSQTDTEVIPNLLSIDPSPTTIGKVINVCKKLKGSYALAIINRKENNTIYLAKQKSPLYVSLQDNEVYLGSDPICFANNLDNYYSLNDFEFCKANMTKLEFFDSNINNIDKNLIPIDNIRYSFEKNNYSHFMLKEIEETPIVLRRIVETYTDTHALDKINIDMINHTNRIIIVGCGTAYHAGLVGAKYIEKFARIDCKCVIASEFRYNNPIIDDHTICIFVSQSGETADTIAGCAIAKELGAKTIALTNVLYSTLAKMTDITLPVCAGPEIAVASTKAYTAQIAIFYMLSKHIANILTGNDFDYFSPIKTLSENMQMPDKKLCEKIADEIKDKDKIFFIGRDFDYITSEEACLKLKEITYLNCYAHPAGELKHGYLALVDSETIVFVIATKHALIEKTLNSAHEVIARGGRVILVTQEKINTGLVQDISDVFTLDRFDEDLMSIVSIGFFQTLSYLTSIKRNINPDQPRNLAKSVTVE